MPHGGCAAKNKQVFKLPLPYVEAFFKLFIQYQNAELFGQQSKDSWFFFSNVKMLAAFRHLQILFVSQIAEAALEYFKNGTNEIVVAIALK
jgi:hypothetical protein